MIKERLMEALKAAAADYNGGMSANAAVVKAASAADFNEHQTERLVEMFNTLAALNKEKDASDPTGSCELASKDDVLKELMGSSMRKAASADCGVADYSFYSTDPAKTNLSIEARNSGMSSMMKAAGCEETVPSDIDVSQRSLYKIISDKIELLKSAAYEADEVVSAMGMAIRNSAIKIAKAIEDPFANPHAADLFKAACSSKSAVDMVGEYSTKVAESTGGMFSSMAVVDSAPIDELLKIASQIDEYSAKIPEYEKKRDAYLSKAAEAEDSMKKIMGLAGKSRKESVADFLSPEQVVKKAGSGDAQPEAGSGASVDDASLTVKIAELIRKSGISSEEVERLARDLEKDAAGKSRAMALVPVSTGDAIDALNSESGLSGEEMMLHNKLRGLILDDLIVNDPIIRDADPNVVAEIYKSLVRSSPRISLDPALVRSVLRASVNSVALSPADVKTLTDVDKGIALSNVERLTNLDSSVKDSNMA